MKVLVTGGLGFIGSHLVNKLISMGDEVTIMDNRLRAAGVDLSARVPIFNRMLPIRGSFDAVVHLASSQGTQRFYDDPKGVLLNNIGLILEVCEYCRSWDVKKLIFASSSEVYGNNPSIPTSEFDPLSIPFASAPRWSYAISKIAGEAVLGQASGVEDVCSLRYFNIYGPGAGNDHVIPQLIKRIASAESGSFVKIKASNSERAFCHVSDAVEATALAVHYSAKMPPALNIGNPEGLISIGALAEKIRNLMRVKVTLQLSTQTLHVGSPLRRCPNISLASFALKWSPKVSLEEGLSELVGSLQKEVASVSSM